MRAQQAAALEIERVVRVERRMVGRKVERPEVVPLGLRLGPLGDGEPELAKDLLDLFDDERDRMFRAAPLPSRRQREILANAGGRRAGDASRTFGERGVQSRARLVESLARGRLVFLGDGAQRFLQRLDAPLAVAEEGDARRFERVGVGGRRNRGDTVAFDGFGFVQITLKIHVS